MSAAGTSLYSHARKRNEVGYVAPVQRQIQNAQVVDHRAYSSAPRLDLGRIRLYFHLLGHLPDFKNGINHSTCVDLQHDSRLQKAPEPRQSSFEPVRTSHEIRQYIASRLVSHCCSGNARVRLRGRYFDTR